MYGLIVKLMVVPGAREKMIGILRPGMLKLCSCRRC